jgi:hypothetical protein
MWIPMRRLFGSRILRKLSKSAGHLTGVHDVSPQPFHRDRFAASRFATGPVRRDRFAAAVPLLIFFEPPVLVIFL